ncbi:hypothetical protein FQA47_021034 [Oryzias melastigma]|uniref:Uncharacterized protein n=1 Tax=Oryzias melastigma TaxID=30732 RepID=A0A834CQR6_ORYME|nr:hypothetical protein FQA47_021034 [Oryzias melastigma]
MKPEVCGVERKRDLPREGEGVSEGCKSQSGAATSSWPQPADCCCSVLDNTGCDGRRGRKTRPCMPNQTRLKETRSAEPSRPGHLAAGRSGPAQSVSVDPPPLPCTSLVLPGGRCRRAHTQCAARLRTDGFRPNPGRFLTEVTRGAAVYVDRPGFPPLRGSEDFPRLS